MNKNKEFDKNSEAIGSYQRCPCSASGVLPDDDELVRLAKDIVNNNDSEKIGKFYRELLLELFTPSNVSKLNRTMWDVSLCVESVITARMYDKLERIPEILKDFGVSPTTLK